MYRISLCFISLFIGAHSLLFTISLYFPVDSRYDLFFETNTLILVLYLAYVSLRAIKSHPFIRYGINCLVINSFYEVTTEIDYFNALASHYPLIDSLMEDGLLQLSFLFLAFGITQLIKSIQESATIDELTGLHNRTKLDSISLAEFDLIYFDLDGLKLVNDTQGHAMGDVMIIRFAHALSESVSSGEQAFRIGGDEFLVIATLTTGQQFVDRVKRQLKDQTIEFSYGIESTTKQQFREALVKTDQAMYKMKNAQRDKR
ncbi:GGDEF domain-containing protein [Vibrio atypicus]|uniref:GGDEF domain-containing protein n=1 Tax=Vibrio atypicus TaxID=558271 RepID=UPI00135B8403|nr:GGDEF domain-containing protein [Vibrio atypicus]